MKNILLLFLSAVIFCVKDVHGSEPIKPNISTFTDLTNPSIPTIEVIQPVEQNSPQVLHIPINNTATEDRWKAHLFAIAIEKKLCPLVLDYAKSIAGQNIAINIAQAIAMFKNSIDANKDIFFKDCPFLYEILFPQRNQSPIKNLNNNSSPQPASPRGRRASGSGQSFFNTFSIDPSIPETNKECVLKNEEQKKLFTNIIAYCILNLNPQLISELCEKIIQSSHSNRIENKNTNDAYKLLEQNHAELTANYKEKISYINELETTINKLNAIIKKLESEVDSENQDSADNNYINNLHTQIDFLTKELEKARQQTKDLENTYAKQPDHAKQLTDLLKQNNDRILMYRLISGISFSTTIILLVCLLYNNGLLSAYYKNMIH
ncbi:hypothetical protein EKK58_04000 [Candidatus Dependentiae bacterium]|nr:MAG: hypothetical protein EKK58_04000 [Candidatus Dependentiae bacterium]